MGAVYYPPPRSPFPFFRRRTEKTESLGKMAAPRGSFAFGKKRGRGQNGPQLKRARTVMVPAWGTRGVSAAAGRRAVADAELKFYDLDIDDAAITAGGVIQTPTNPGPAAAQASVNGIKQGVGEKERIGRKCVIRSIGWRYRLTLPEVDAVANPGAGDTVRVIVYLDKQANGAAATVTGILETGDFQSFNNLANKGRFRILMDKVVTLSYLALASDNAAVVSSPGVRRSYSWFKDCNIRIEFDNTTGALSEIRSNNVGILLVGETSVAGFESKMRLRFSDG